MWLKNLFRLQSSLKVLLIAWSVSRFAELLNGFHKPLKFLAMCGSTWGYIGVKMSFSPQWRDKKNLNAGPGGLPRLNEDKFILMGDYHIWAILFIFRHLSGGAWIFKDGPVPAKINISHTMRE